MEDVNRVSLRGYVGHIIFRNDENGYTVLSLNCDDEEITVVGSFPPVNEGEYVEAEGEYIFHPTYGRQFSAVDLHSYIPTETDALGRYLASGAIKGIGAALAARIISRFGDDTLRIMEDEPERLAEVRGISARKAREIGSQIEERRAARSALVFLAGFGISPAMGLRIYDRYQERVYSVIREDPYELAETIQGIGFRTADEISSRCM